MAPDIASDHGDVATTRRIERRRWRAMGSDAEVIVIGGADGLADRAVERIEELESRWSRFRPDSEVSTLNRHAGTPVEVSADTALLVRAAIDAWRESGGAVNPTVLGELERAGYDTTFSQVAAGHPSRLAVTSDLVLVACTDIEVGARSVMLPAGTGFDPGGVGKGLAADLVAHETVRAGAAGVCVNLGGDVRVGGDSPSGAGWTISIDAPLGGRSIALVGIADGAVATSTTARRRWQVGDDTAHHLIDTATGQPSETDLVQASVVASSALIAEVHAKTVLLRGAERAFDVLPLGVGALAVHRDGTIVSTPDLARHLGGAALPARLDPEEVWGP